MEAAGLIKRSSVTSDQASIGTSFSTSKVHAHVLPSKGNAGDETFRATLKTLRIGLSSISSAAVVTVKVCEDADGDVIIVPDTEADISLGITTVASGAVVYDIDAPIWTLSGSTLYVFIKVDAGTVTMANSQITWEVT